MLLNLAQGESGADGVDRSGGDEKRVAGGGVEPLEQVFDLAGERGFAQLAGGDGFAEARGDLCAGLGGEDVPHLRFPERIVMLTGVVIVRMDLHGQLFGGEEEFDQKREIGDALKPDFADFRWGVGEKGLEVGRTPDFFLETGREADHA